MNQQERMVGDCRISAAAINDASGGYVAAAVIHRLAETPDEHEIVFSDERISGGFRFETPAAALKHALDTAHRALRVRSGQVTCRPARRPIN
jgi:hypothetical protein